MKRSLEKLANHNYDVLVIGGGIYGACVARDAALRGLSVALVEKNDFGAATSANSLKIVHGGLRYLQDGNLKLVRSMIKERANWLRIAPHLVHPLPFMMPTYGRLTRSKPAMGAAMAIIDSIGFDRNRQVDPQNQLPNGRVLSKSATLDKMHWLDQEATGGVVWHDAQIYDTERLLIAVISSAAEAGATVANYVEVNGFLMDGRVISGVSVEESLSGQRFDIRAKLVINCSGAWSDQVLGLLEDQPLAPTFPLSAAINLVIGKLPLENAIGIPSSYWEASESGQSKQRTRMLFITPWQDHAIAGTWHIHFDGRAQDFQVTEERVQSYIDELNAAYPAIDLKREDVLRVHAGFLPLDEESPSAGRVQLLRESQIHDHAQTDGVKNLVTISGVKYTTARQGAERVVDLAMRKLEYPPAGCRTAKLPLNGGDIPHLNNFFAEAVASRPGGISEQSMMHLLHSYGSNYAAVLDIAAQEPDWTETITAESPVLKAEIIYAVRQEMALTLADVVYRRTPLGAVGPPDMQSVRTCADLMAAESGWDQARCEQEIAAANNEFSNSKNRQTWETHR